MEDFVIGYLELIRSINDGLHHTDHVLTGIKIFDNRIIKRLHLKSADIDAASAETTTKYEIILA